MSFDGLIGNDNIKKILTESVNSKNIIHSYMFYGTDGIGKRLFATEFAKMILCNGDSRPCNNCKSCVEFNTNNHPDFFVIEPDNGSLKIDQIREMQKNILEKPVSGEKKIYIINDADKMTKEAQNCLLKTLEEPQNFIVIILICSNENNILPTVKSRCAKIFFNSLDKQQIESYMAENFSDVIFDENMIELCNGSIGKAVGIVDKKEILEELKLVIDSVDKTDKLEFLLNTEFFNKNKDDINLLLEYTYVLLFKFTNTKERMSCIESMKYVQNAKNKILKSNNFDMTIDYMLINIWEEFNEKNNRY